MINYVISECSKLPQKVFQIKHNEVGEGDLLEIVQEIEI